MLHSLEVRWLAVAEVITTTLRQVEALGQKGSGLRGVSGFEIDRCEKEHPF